VFQQGRGGPSATVTYSGGGGGGGLAATAGTSRSGAASAAETARLARAETERLEREAQRRQKVLLDVTTRNAATVLALKREDQLRAEGERAAARTVSRAAARVASHMANARDEGADAGRLTGAQERRLRDEFEKTFLRVASPRDVAAAAAPPSRAGTPNSPRANRGARAAAAVATPLRETSADALWWCAPPAAAPSIMAGGTAPAASAAAAAGTAVAQPGRPPVAPTTIHHDVEAPRSAPPPLPIAAIAMTRQQ
jgi:hypothetical protein